MEAAAHPIVFFDGVCNLCNSAVQFIIRADKQGQFRFASLQSPTAQKALEALKTQDGKVPDSIVLYYEGKYYTRSAAAMHIARLLGGGYKLVYGLGSIIPRALRDGLYNLIAHSRYCLFGKRDACMIPTPELRSRFIDG